MCIILWGIGNCLHIFPSVKVTQKLITDLIKEHEDCLYSYVKVENKYIRSQGAMLDPLLYIFIEGWTNNYWGGGEVDLI